MDSLVGLPGPHSRARSTPPALPGKVLTVDLSSAPAMNESRILLRGSSPSDDLPLKKNQARIFFFFLLENERRKRWDTEEWNVDSVWQLRVFKDKQYCRIRSSAWTVQYVSRFFFVLSFLCARYQRPFLMSQLDRRERYDEYMCYPTALAPPENLGLVFHQLELG